MLREVRETLEVRGIVVRADVDQERRGRLAQTLSLLLLVALVAPLVVVAARLVVALALAVIVVAASNPLSCHSSITVSRISFG